MHIYFPKLFKEVKEPGTWNVVGTCELFRKSYVFILLLFQKFCEGRMEQLQNIAVKEILSCRASCSNILHNCLIELL